MMKTVLMALSLAQLCLADLRFAAQPETNNQPRRRRRRVINGPAPPVYGETMYEIRTMSRRRLMPFNTSHAVYFEPSDFQYAGLIKQRDNRGYDNFLRSNIDNQQDRRDFVNEDGKDHLPFRTYEGAATDASPTQKNKIPVMFEGNEVCEYDNRGVGYCNAVPVGGSMWDNRCEDTGSGCGRNSGTCTCPDGKTTGSTVTYPVGDNGDRCATVGCSGVGAVTSTGADGACAMGIPHSVECGPPITGAITATPGEPVMAPLRWNNPHSAELEVNIWIVNRKYVVPIMKPTCSGEGYQDNYFSFTVPRGFNNLGTKVPGFTGCKKVGDCVLQLYAHSVESRTYAIGTPLIVEGPVVPATATATTEAAIAPAPTDKGLDVSALRDLCLPRNDPSANIATPIPRFARLVSDQYNHAFQNSDFSPYSGQQFEAISKNMQASCVLKMVSGNRGELGKHALNKDNREGFNFQRSLDRKAKKLVRQYEKLANSLINLIGGKMKNTETVAPARNFRGELKPQQLEECFRCNEVGATVAKRHETTTYIPSFKVRSDLLGAVKALVSDEYANLISPTGLVQIYMTAMNDLMDEFKKGEKLNITYQPAMLKTTLTTMADATGIPTNFKKKDANGATDDGLYAAREAYKKFGAGPWRDTPYMVPPDGNSWMGSAPAVGTNSALAASLAADFPLGGSFVLPANADGVTEIIDQFDPNGVYADSNCDNMDPEANSSETECVQPTEKLFEDPPDIEAEASNRSTPTKQGVVDSALQKALPFSVLLVCLLAFA